MGFTGFTPDTYRFMLELELQNNKPFFEANKQRYKDSLQGPMRAFAAELMPVLRGIDPALDADPARVVSRVYRDARRTHGVDPYRSNTWMTFKHPTSSTSEAFCMYFEIDTTGYGYGMGTYGASPLMGHMRERMFADPACFLSLVNAPALKSFELRGESFKRDRYPDAPAELKPYLNRKGLSWCYFNADPTRTYDGPALYAEVTSGLKALAPLYQFLTFQLL